MSRTSKAIGNSVVSLISQVTSVLTVFIIRKIFLDYLSVELLGISATLLAVINTLSLSELGFQTAIVYFLYKPLAQNDHNKINQIMNLFKVVYRVVAIVIAVGGLIIAPFLPNLLKGVEINSYIYAIFFLHCSASIVSYLLAYKRALLFADQSAYVSSAIDTVTNIIISILRIVVIVKLQSYVAYVFLSILQNLISNLLVDYVCRKRYLYLDTKVKFEKQLAKNIFVEVKNIFIGKIAAYVYTSTDNLLISAFINTVSVGFLTNYLTLKNSISGLINSFLSPILPSVGNYITNQGTETSGVYILFRKLTFIRFTVACVFVVPLASLIQPFIGWWIGEKYILSYSIVALIVAEIYCSILMGPCGDFLSAAGYFSVEKNISAFGAILKLVVALSLVKIIGIQGVLLGTLISQIYFWIARFVAVNKKVLKLNKAEICGYIFRCVLGISVFILAIISGLYVYSILNFLPFILRFILSGCLIESIIAILITVVFYRSLEYKYVLSLVLQAINKIVKRR